MEKEIRVCPVCKDKLDEINWGYGIEYICRTQNCPCHDRAIPFDKIVIVKLDK